MALKKEDITRVKGMGFLINRGTECFSGRLVPQGSVFKAEDLAVIADISKKFGNGKVTFTARLAAEIVGISYENIDKAIEYAQANNLYFGGTGAKIRPVVGCKGTTCIYGNFDTQEFAKQIHSKFYLGWRDVKLAHKFKITVGGCPNSCMKPSLNDFGVEGRKTPIYDNNLCKNCKSCTVVSSCPVKSAKIVEGKLSIDQSCKSCGVCVGKCPFGVVDQDSPVKYQIYIGGTWGKTARIGTPLNRLVVKEEILPLLEKTLLWFKQNAYQKERLGNVVDRLGEEKLQKDLFCDKLVKNKQQILNMEILQRP